jgi:hypothetical protein
MTQYGDLASHPETTATWLKGPVYAIPVPGPVSLARLTTAPSRCACKHLPDYTASHVKRQLFSTPRSFLLLARAETKPRQFRSRVGSTGLSISVWQVAFTLATCPQQIFERK